MEAALIVEKLSKSYGDKKAVAELSFTVHKGETFGLLGPNGAGKTTTIECILGTKRYNGGSVSLLGEDPKRKRKELFERVSVQFQESHYQEKITVCELCELTQSLYKNPGDFKELLKAVGLLDKMKQQVSSLSGGERQRLFVVLALIPKPELVFLDELTTGLDTKARRIMWKYLQKLKEEGLTILLTSHYMDEIEALCDNICIMKKGEMVFRGTISEAIKQSSRENLEDAYLWFTEGDDFEDESF